MPGSHPAAQDRDAILAAPSALHWAGTDDLGRDRAVRTAAALLLSLAGATGAAAVTTFLAAVVGITAAFSPAPLAWLLLLVTDVFLTLPWLFLLMIVRAGLPLSASPGHAASLTFLLLAVLGWPACAHAVARGAARLRHSQPMRYGRAAGLRPLQAIRLHILPHLRALLLPQFLLAIPAFVMAEANLGALGLGIPEPLPSLGAMLLDSRQLRPACPFVARAAPCCYPRYRARLAGDHCPPY